MEVVGKVVARVIQERLLKLAEDVSPESQCGFRKGRGCIVRQLEEKSWEHKSKAIFTFVDLKKAYDSVSREAMWLALNKLGVSHQFAELIKSFHEETKVKIRWCGFERDQCA